MKKFKKIGLLIVASIFAVQLVGCTSKDVKTDEMATYEGSETGDKETYDNGDSLNNIEVDPRVKEDLNDLYEDILEDYKEEKANYNEKHWNDEMKDLQDEFSGLKDSCKEELTKNIYSSLEKLLKACDEDLKGKDQSSEIDSLSKKIKDDLSKIK